MGGVDIRNYSGKTQSASAASGSGKVMEWMNKDIKLGSSRLSDKKKEAFYLELSILLEAGVDIKSALELIEQEQEKKKEKAIVQDIREKVIYGKGLSEAVRSTGKFTPYEYYSLQIGEETGRMVKVLQELATFFKKKVNQQRQVVNALSYPVIVLVTSFGAIFFMMHFIVPMFAGIFERFGGEIPGITQAIIDMADFMNAYSMYMIGGLAALIGFLAFNRKKAWYRRWNARILMRLPLVGKIVRKMYLARFSQSMALLMGAQVPMIRAIGLIKQMIGFEPIETSLIQVETDIMNGKSLHSSLQAFSIFDPRMISLVKVGEQVNKLETFFEKIAEQYSEEVEHQTSIIGNLIEPFMIIFLGLVVGIILIAMYLPLFKLSSSMGGF